jgi:hypothetical protein
LAVDLRSFGPQFIAKDFEEFVRVCGLTHVRTSPYYPQSNGKIERWHQSRKADCIRPGTPLCLEDARRLVAIYVDHYNTIRLHSAIGYITPCDKLFAKKRPSLPSVTTNSPRPGFNDNSNANINPPTPCRLNPIFPIDAEP